MQTDQLVRPARLELLEDVVGFGRNATGGAEGGVYHVTTLEDDGQGSLRAGVESSAPLWIVFDVSGDIRLRRQIGVQPNKTIDGRGARIVIRDNGLIADGVNNAIVENLIFDGAQIDAISIVNGGTDIWIDHCSLSNAGDGLIDITRAVPTHSTDVTVSWCHFSKHDKVMLIGASPDATDDVNLRVTLHHDFFDETSQRHPRLSFGKVHAFNNYLRHWETYGMGSAQRGELLIQANIFEAGSDKDGSVHRFNASPLEGFISITKGEDLLINGARIGENGFEQVFSANEFYAFNREVADATLQADIKAHAGWRDLVF